MTAHPLAVVIPAYRPDGCLTSLVKDLSSWGVPLIVVDDGSGPAFQERFRSLAAFPNVEIVEHSENRGKGAALRSGFQFALQRFPGLPGIVTADADGQHLPGDIRRVGQRLSECPDALVLGTRQFGTSTPFRSRIGNRLTRTLYRALHGSDLRDTQTGLRGIPRSLVEAMLRSKANRYEFELEMLIAARGKKTPVEHVEIPAVYSEGNRSSHFRPWRDSMRIYFVLLRFSAVSVITAICDNAVFYALLGAYGQVLSAQVCGRLLAILINFRLNRGVVFHFPGSGPRVWARYLTLVAASGAVSYAGIMALNSNFGIALFPAKLMAETLLFPVNFVLLRDFVFLAPSRARTTDWNAYYRHVPWTARLTRRYTCRCVIEALGRAGLGRLSRPVVAEFGGGNSCFARDIVRHFAPRTYHVVDNNPLGLDLLRGQSIPSVELHPGDVRKVALPEPADAVVSVGLVEHFDPAEVVEVVGAHFRQAKRGGWVLISFPCPTRLYRATRALLEFAGLWRFPDERPLGRQEVLAAAAGFGEVAWERTLWPLPLTQHMMLFRARA